MVDKHRVQRINDQMQREIGAILLREMQDSRIQKVSITHVDVSRDLAVAKVYYTILGDTTHKELTQAALENAAGLVRKRIAEEMDLRKTPQLRFIYDQAAIDSLNLSAKIDAAIAADNAKKKSEDN